MPLHAVALPRHEETPRTACPTKHDRRHGKKRGQAAGGMVRLLFAVGGVRIGSTDGRKEGRVAQFFVFRNEADEGCQRVDL
jgi:hypothetical protein